MSELQELKGLRDNTRKAIAGKICEIVKYCNDNNLDTILDIRYILFSNSSMGLLLIDNEDEVELYMGDIENQKIDSLSNDIRCNYEKAAYCGYDYGTKGYYKPTINQCKDWIDNKLEELAQLQKIELQELRKVMKKLQ